MAELEIHVRGAFWSELPENGILFARRGGQYLLSFLTLFLNLIFYCLYFFSFVLSEFAEWAWACLNGLIAYGLGKLMCTQALVLYFKQGQPRSINKIKPIKRNYISVKQSQWTPQTHCSFRHCYYINAIIVT